MKHEGSCHCGAVAFELDGDVTEAMECNCSICRRRGSLLAFFPREKLVLTTPPDAIGNYRFNTHKIEHHFCTTCGIAPFSDGIHPKTGEAMAAVNVRCLPDVDLASLKINQVDGARF
jgi:hypothetical protein